MKKKEKELSTKRSRPHWRQFARKCFSEHDEIFSSDDEEYAIYNLFFQLRKQLVEAIVAGHHKIAARILDFAGCCLRDELGSDGEDISVAAGVSLFEHLFEDLPMKHWPAVFSCMPFETYHASRYYLEQWMGTDGFANVAEAAKKHYSSRKHPRSKLP